MQDQTSLHLEPAMHATSSASLTCKLEEVNSWFSHVAERD
jgi:hypothetical protein